MQHLRQTRFTGLPKPRHLLLLAAFGLMLGTTLPRAAAQCGVKSLACASQTRAYLEALSFAGAHGGSVVITSGTPSMEPLIHGRTYAVIQHREFAAIHKYDILEYNGRPDAARPDRFLMLHRAVMRDRHGWIMSGDHNRWSESWDRVTSKTYVGTLVALFTFPADEAVPVASPVGTTPVSGQ